VEEFFTRVSSCARLGKIGSRLPASAKSRPASPPILGRLTHVDVEKDYKRFRIRSSTSGCAGKVFQALGVAAPPSIRRIATEEGTS
jgi:hypothetical protein